MRFTAPCMSGKNELISGDAPGVALPMSKRSSVTTVLFINGAAGDTAPIYSVYPDPKSGHLSQFRVLLGDRILQANSRLAAGTGDVTLRADQIVVELTSEAEPQWPEESSAVLARMTTAASASGAPSRAIP